MKFSLVSSLESAALTSISATLWKIWGSPHDTKDLPYLAEDPVKITDRKYGLPDIDSAWEKGRSKVKESVRRLILPENLKAKLSEFADAVGGQIEAWLQQNLYNWKLVDKFPETFAWSWTSSGTIDFQKTANSMVCDNAIDIGSRCRLACYYCLEEHVLTLFNQIDEERVGYINLFDPAFQNSDLYPYVEWHRVVEQERTDYISHIREYFQSRQRQQRNIDCHADNNYSPGCSPIELFEKSLELCGFCVAAKYFYLKSLEKQNNESIVPIIKRVLAEFSDNCGRCYSQDANVLCFLLNHMNEDQQMQVLRSAAPIVLDMFLHWPWYELFIKVYQLVGHLLSKVDFSCLLSNLMEEKECSCQHYYYEQIFLYVWQKASAECRNFVYSYHDDEEYFENLCERENWDACKLLLEYVPENDRRERLSGWFHEARECFTSLISEGKWGKIESFLTICRLSNLEIVIFRDSIIKQSHLPPGTEEKIKIFNNIIDSFITANEKRCIENNESEPKRFCGARS